MSWSVEAYDEDPPSGVVTNELLTFINRDPDPQVRLDAARLTGWLKAVHNGNGAPDHEPDAPPSAGLVLKYRCEGTVIVIFSIAHPPRMVVLRFARSANAFPRNADGALAATRWAAWRP